MAQGSGPGSGLIFFTFLLLGVGVVGGYWYMRNRSSNVPPSTIETDALGNPLMRNDLCSVSSPWYGAVDFTAGGPVPSVLDTSIRAGIPITSGSKRGYDIDRFSKTALGTCQCNEEACCYKGIYQPKHGDTDTEKICDDIHYGDYVETCERLVRRFEDRVFYAKSNYAGSSRRNAVYDPYRAFLSRRRLNNVRS